mgnify:CR=1 FL=1
MKRIIILLIMLFNLFSSYSQQSIYDISINDITGKNIDLKIYKGKYIMIVNVASECGFTKQYKDLEALYNKYKDNLIVIGVPCNQFGGQEPGNEKDIMSFCQRNFGVTFLLTEKIDVKGRLQHPLYRWLTNKKFNSCHNSTVRWNFQKYLVGRDGSLINYFYSTTSPLSDKITSILEKN